MYNLTLICKKQSNTRRDRTSGWVFFVLQLSIPYDIRPLRYTRMLNNDKRGLGALRILTNKLKNSPCPTQQPFAKLVHVIQLAHT